MARVYGYVRLSQEAEGAPSPRDSLTAAGFDIAPQDYVEEIAACTTSSLQRRLFLGLVERLGPGDTLVTLQPDALGRSVVDLSDTIAALASIPVRVVCLAFGDADIAGAQGRATRDVVEALARFERRLIEERRSGGATRVRPSREAAGRPPLLSLDQQLEIVRRRAAGESLGELARIFGVSKAAIQRVQRRMAPHRTENPG